MAEANILSLFQVCKYAHIVNVQCKDNTVGLLHLDVTADIIEICLFILWRHLEHYLLHCTPTDSQDPLLSSRMSFKKGRLQDSFGSEPNLDFSGGLNRVSQHDIEQLQIEATNSFGESLQKKLLDIEGLYSKVRSRYTFIQALVRRGFFSTIFSSLFGTREMRILILGLDGAGKTTILYRLQVGEVVTTIPTIGFNVETVTYKNLKFQVWDLGGQTSIRPYWRCYYSNTDAVIYVVDSCDRDRIGTSKSELVAMLEEEELKKAILVVFANKQDMEQAMTPTEMANALGLPALKDRKWQIFKTSATKGTGLDEAMEWLVEALKSRQ
ncbi:hypothetical protein WISP_144333 [Willisornis vidua]|uniref:ADP-ribosylation factor-like protein 1 n=1 Tax=Willisornis vidua TaxID=1566151 RepID=A0ABQ9CM73_9PASS|nr:hypothetical protein WISP_144333 [Willisornis vidua]